MRSASLSAWVCAGLFSCVALPLCISNYDHGRAFSDQMTYHYPAILHFVNGGSVTDYPSATTPGFHLLLAAFARWVSDTELALKLANFTLTATLLALVARDLSRQLNSVALTVMMLLPMMFSIYILPSGVWLLPDNLAWLSVFCLLFLAARFSDEWRWYGLTSLTLVAAVLVRQSNLWLCVVVFAVAWLVESREGGNSLPRRLIRLGTAALATLPSIAVLGYFFNIWHGMTPPAFAEKHTGFNLAAVAFFLCLLAFYSVFYLPLIVRPVHRLLSESRSARYHLCLGAAVGLLAALITPTDWDPPNGRVSGLWNLARMLPDIQHRSVAIAMLAILGGMLAAVWLRLVEPRTRVIVGAATLGFIASQSVSHFVYERYYAGLVFLLLLMMTANVLQRWPEPPPRWSLGGPLLFALFNAAVLGAGLVSG
jgi:hypothetical protein